jgi:hypothetical protein
MGLSPARREMGNDNHVVVSHKLCGFQWRVGRDVFVMKEPVVVAPKIRSFSSHTFLQASQNITVRVQIRVDRSVRRNKFTVKNPFHVKKNKQWSCSLFNSGPAAPFFFFFCSFWLCALPLQQLLICFWVITVIPTFVTRYDPRHKRWVLVDLLS